ncbi:MAG: family 20 glycosylhydrolase, partial [Bacteroidaceae bacterium]|nr:family 20 glycosylhydrolase [Bacteroidaceae bacterium]
MPTPSKVEALRCLPFSLGRSIQLEDPSGCVLLKRWLSQQSTLEEEAEAVVKVKIDPELTLFDYFLEGFPAEGYEMEVCANEITIVAATSLGVIRATQTLMQLADTTTQIPACRISDAPAFKLRGVMHDVGRSFLGIEELRREIDLLSRFKINTFHWHLTENQAWRFEVKAYPQLT